MKLFFLCYSQYAEDTVLYAILSNIDTFTHKTIDTYIVVCDSYIQCNISSNQGQYPLVGLIVLQSVWNSGRKSSILAQGWETIHKFCWTFLIDKVMELEPGEGTACLRSSPLHWSAVWASYICSACVGHSWHTSLWEGSLSQWQAAAVYPSCSYVLVMSPSCPCWHSHGTHLIRTLLARWLQPASPVGCSVIITQVLKSPSASVHNAFISP